MKVLMRGQKSKLSEIFSHQQFVVGLKLDAPSLILDASCLGLDIHGMLSDERFFVFYNQMVSPGGAIKLLDTQDGKSYRFLVDLECLPSSITRLMFVVSVDGRGTLEQVENGSLWLEVDSHEKARLSLDKAMLGTESAAILLEFTRGDSNIWEVISQGESIANGLTGLLKRFGGQVAEEDVEAEFDVSEAEALTERGAELDDVHNKPSKPINNRSTLSRSSSTAIVMQPVSEEFRSNVLNFVARIPEICPNLQSEEATKSALVLPFLNLLGYDVFNPLEVVPEFTADHGIKKGEKVDYAIKSGSEMIMLLECKRCGDKLDPNHASQLFRYFTVTEARLGVLTNGVVYQFYADLEAPNKMDTVPFLEIDLRHLKEEGIAELAKLSKQNFNVRNLLDNAKELKYLRAVQKLLNEQMSEPSDEFLRFFASKVGYGTLHAARRAQFSLLTQQAFQNLIAEAAKERLQDAISASDSLTSSISSLTPVVEPKEPKNTKGADASDDEWQGFFIIKAILRQYVVPSRISERPTLSYFGIVLDNNSRKPLARLYFNSAQKYLGLFNEARQERRIPIDDLNHIFLHADELKRVLSFYEK